MRQVIVFSSLTLLVLILSGCAAGSAAAATAGYSLKAQSADSLSAEAEERIVERVKREIKAELAVPHNVVTY